MDDNNNCISKLVVEYNNSFFFCDPDTESSPYSLDKDDEYVWDTKSSASPITSRNKLIKALALSWNLVEVDVDNNNDSNSIFICGEGTDITDDNNSDSNARGGSNNTGGSTDTHNTDDSNNLTNGSNNTGTKKKVIVLDIIVRAKKKGGSSSKKKKVKSKDHNNNNNDDVADADNRWIKFNIRSFTNHTTNHTNTNHNNTITILIINLLQI